MQPWGRLPDCLAEAELDSSTQRSPGGQRAVVSPSLKAVSLQIARRECWASPRLAGLGLEQPFTYSPWGCWNTLNAVGCLDLLRAVPLLVSGRRERQISVE